MNKLPKSELPFALLEYRKWKQEHPDPDYQYDEIKDFMSGIDRGDTCYLLETLDEMYE